MSTSPPTASRLPLQRIMWQRTEVRPCSTSIARGRPRCAKMMSIPMTTTARRTCSPVRSADTRPARRKAHIPAGQRIRRRERIAISSAAARSRVLWSSRMAPTRSIRTLLPIRALMSSMVSSANLTAAALSAAQRQMLSTLVFAVRQSTMSSTATVGLQLVVPVP